MGVFLGANRMIHEQFKTDVINTLHRSTTTPSRNDGEIKKTGWQLLLLDLIRLSREKNHDLRFGQTIYNAISLYDKTSYDSEYDPQFHARLFNIEDTELKKALEQWFEFVDSQQSNKNRG